jgi:hypothetical protein
MRTRRLGVTWIAGMVIALRVADAQRSERPAWALTGSFYNVYSDSRTVIPPAQDFALDLSRLRLKLAGRPMAHLAVDVQYDNELLLGNYLSTAQYALLRRRPAVTSFDLTHEYITRGNVVARHQLYRATLAWSGSVTDVRVGRQRVALGTGQFWSPLDLLNPLDPTRLERDYRTGVDAIVVERKLGAVSRVQGMFAPGTRRARAIAGAYLHGNVRGADFSILAGRFRGDDAIGVDISAARGGLGLRGEATITRPVAGPRFGRVLLGGDYGFANTVNLSAEVYANGQGATDRNRYDYAALTTGRTFSLGRYYGAVAASYQVTPLVKATVYAVTNAGDGSAVVWPRLEYSAASNLDLVLGLQRFVGDETTEYGRLSNLLHGEVRWFF